MGLFGGAQKTTTKVRPSRQVEDILKNVVSETQNMPDNGFTNYNLAGLNATQQGALSSLAQSGELNKLASMFGGRTQQGIDQLNQAAGYLNTIANGGVTGRQVQDYANTVTGKNSLGTRALAQGIDAGGAMKALGGSAALRSAGRRSGGQINALGRNQLGQQAKGQGITNLLNNVNDQRQIAGQIAGQAGTNLGLGAQGVSAAQQALQNQLQAGNIEQQQAQRQNEVDWQNQMGAQQYDWNQINNKLNVLNEVSPMAGYTTEGLGGGISKSNQLLGAGMTGLGIAGKLGYLGNSANALQNSLNTGQTNWAGLTQGATANGNIGGIPVYKQASASPWSQGLGALSSMFGGGQ